MTYKPAHRRALAATWHNGERQMQRRAGFDEVLDDLAARVNRNHLNPSQASFIRQLPYVVAGSVDSAGSAWATMLEGGVGMMFPATASELTVAAVRNASDPADPGMSDGSAVGLLCIDLATRRRLRINGWLNRHDDAEFVLEIEQCFGICRKYIHSRELLSAKNSNNVAQEPPLRMTVLDDQARNAIALADTFFVASYVDRDGVRQVDVSHRGGVAGFVRVDDRGVLTIPDFAGNKFFNTMGNFFVNPTAGITFVDFATGDLLQLSGAVRLDPAVPDTAFAGAERVWQMEPRAIVRRVGALRSRWQLTEIAEEVLPAI